MRLCASQLGAIALTLATLILPASGASTAPPTLQLLNQSSFTVAQGSFSLTLHASLPSPNSMYAVRLALYPALSNRTEFTNSITATEPSDATCLTKTPLLPLSSGTRFSDGINLSLQLHVIENNTTTTCASSDNQLTLQCAPGSCAGVYPVQVTMIDELSGRVVRRFTTHLIELDTPSPSAHLNVGLVLALGSSLAIGPNGESTLTSSELHHLAAVVETLNAHHGLHLSLSIYPQLIDALQRTQPEPSTVITRLESLLNRRVAHHLFGLLTTPYAPLNTSALATADRSNTFGKLIALGTTTWLTAGLPARGTGYLAPAPLSSGGENLLARACVNSIVLPSGTPLSTANGLTQTAPIGLPTTAQCPSHTPNAAATAFIADPAVTTLSASPNNPILEAHLFLAALAQIYFEQPGLSHRSVVLTPPESTSPIVLDQVLTELTGSPFVNTETLGSLFSSSTIGANGNTTAIALPSATQGSTSLSKLSLARADEDLRVLSALVPADTALLALARRDLELGETAGLSASARSAYLGAPNAEISTIAHALSFVRPYNFTLTASSGNLPITLDQSGAADSVHVHIRLQSSDLLLPNGSSENVILHSSATSLSKVLVETRGSGSSLLTITVLSPVGNRILLSEQFTVISTAISLPAVLLSGLALAVLAMWWVRSFRRRRRKSVEAAKAA